MNAFNFFLYSRHFNVLSESVPLEYYKHSSSPVNPSHQRWLIDLYNYIFTLKYAKGDGNMLEDYFSCDDFTNHFQQLCINPALIHDENILPKTSSAILELHQIANEISQENQLTQETRVSKFV